MPCWWLRVPSSDSFPRPTTDEERPTIDDPLATISSFAPGSRLGRYRLVERIGAGGMGQVWRAKDANLDRDVAVKLLHRAGDERSRARFRREALVLSRLSHPGVATIFDFDSIDGCDFLVMEYVPGGTLASRLARGPLPVEDLLRYGLAIAEGLQSAHRSGFLHRDLKPGNVVISGQDHPKILDFGVALMLGGGEDVQRITQAGMALGSVPYMSPEQLFGDADDARADIYSFGVMLFEMATGRLPFIKDRPEALMFAIINNAAPSVRSLRPEIPEALEALIEECMRKDPAHRPASADDVAATLRRLLEGTRTDEMRQPARPVIRAMAVLPLRNVSGDPAQEYFVGGMTEAIISDLSRIKALRVISRTSAMKYRDTTLSLPEVARELNVDAVLEGSALLIGNRVRVNVQLIRARDEETLWSSSFDRDVEDVLRLQSELAQTVAREIAVQLTPHEKSNLGSVPQAINREAYDEFLKSRHSWQTGSREGIDLGLRHARRALAIDPNFALAWSALADCHTVRAMRGLAPYAEAAGEAIAAAKRALEIDPLLGDARASLGIIQVYTGHLHEGVASLRKAMQSNPGHALSHNILARALISLERFDEALPEAQKGIALDPLSVFNQNTVGDVYYYNREFEKSLLAYRLSLEIDSRLDATHTEIARSLEALGRFDEARAKINEARALSGGLVGPSFALAHLEAAAGNEAEARKILNELLEARSTRVVSAWGIAAIHASLGDVDEAFRWLETAIGEGASGLIMLRVHPRLDP
ncbi:MAG TPA: protein kinase, partial [Gemmatimonadaceae bacterium]|nr:protein kinase [Gemmatimonadaceae bacterium]